jgi:hypothetical protein
MRVPQNVFLFCKNIENLRKIFEVSDGLREGHDLSQRYLIMVTKYFLQNLVIGAPKSLAFLEFQHAGIGTMLT